MHDIKSKYDVVIVGAGVTGAAAAYALGYTNTQEVLVAEKYAAPATVNSHPANNSHTSHDGGTETNYSLEKALVVQEAARDLRRYVESRTRAGAEGLFRKTHRMVLGIGWAQRTVLEERFEEFREHYPDLRLIGRKELEELEPLVVRGRDPGEELCALVSDEGYALNYQRVAEELLQDAHALNPALEVRFGMEVLDITWEGEEHALYLRERGTGTEHSVYARTVLFAAGSYSLFFAHRLGYGLEYGILPIAGSFYSAGELLNGKVYMIQIEGLPFAAIHADPDVLGSHETRFGPTTKPLPLMERHHYETVPDFLQTGLASFAGMRSLIKIIREKKLFGYIAKNMVFDLPVMGRYLFLKKEAQKIVPSITYRQLRLRRGAGGVRPQLVHLPTGTLEMGERTIEGENILFSTTPSPGASVCLGNGKKFAAEIAGFLGDDVTFYEEAFDHSLDHPVRPTAA